MKALTIWQPWAALIMAGAKPYEFRRWPAPDGLVGQRIVIHAGARAVRSHEVEDLLEKVEDGWPGTALVREIALPVLRKIAANPHLTMLGVGLGAAVLGKPRRCTELFRGAVADSDRIDEHMWAWPLSDIQAFDAPVPARGLQSFWEWPA